MSSNFFVKSNVTFGSGSLAALPDILTQMAARKIMVVYDGGVKAAGIAGKVLAVLDAQRQAYVVFDGVLPNPTNALVEQAAELAKREAVSGFLAVGGGSSIDLAKAVNVLMTNPGAIGDYGGIGKVKNNLLPLLAIPTTAGTSSEITNVTALVDTEAKVKYVVIDNRLTPDYVIADPALTVTMPAAVTAATGMDAITHAAESYISGMATPLTEYHSLEALRLLYKNLPKVLADGGDLEAREQMMLGCVIGGFAFSNANLGMVHAIAHVLGARFGMAHGVANAVMLPHVMAFNAAVCPEKMADMARTVGIGTTGAAEGDALLFAGALGRLTRQAGIGGLSEQGIREADLPLIAAEALKEPVLSFNPRQNVTQDEMLAVLRQAL